MSGAGVPFTTCNFFGTAPEIQRHVVQSRTARANKKFHNQINKWKTDTFFRSQIMSQQPTNIRADQSQEQRNISDLLSTLENYAPAIPDSVAIYFLRKNGVQNPDPRIVRLFSLASQKYISDIVLDSMQQVSKDNLFFHPLISNIKHTQA